MTDKQPTPPNYGRYDSESFEQAAAPLIEWLNYNANPHALVTVQQGLAVLHTAEIAAVFPVPD